MPSGYKSDIISGLCILICNLIASVDYVVGFVVDSDSGLCLLICNIIASVGYVF